MGPEVLVWSLHPEPELLKSWTFPLGVALPGYRQRKGDATLLNSSTSNVCFRWLQSPFATDLGFLLYSRNLWKGISWAEATHQMGCRFFATSVAGNSFFLSWKWMKYKYYCCLVRETQGEGRPVFCTLEWLIELLSLSQFKNKKPSFFHNVVEYSYHDANRYLEQDFFQWDVLLVLLK